MKRLKKVVMVIAEQSKPAALVLVKSLAVPQLTKQISRMVQTSHDPNVVYQQIF